jgi:transposase
LRDRWLQCVCGLSLSRDHNAALNILAIGQTKTVGASTDYRSDCQPTRKRRRRGEDRRLHL